MKKIMIIAAVAMAAIASQAATFKWSTSATGKIYQAGSTTDLLASGTAYLFDANTVLQSALVEAFAAGTLNLATAGYIDKQTLSAAGTLGGQVTPDYGAVGTSYSFYFAIVDGDSLYVGPTKSATGYEGKDAAVSFAAKASSQLAAVDASSGYSAAGWYSSVPEPTSGLLLLLGMAGLALKRKHA